MMSVLIKNLDAQEVRDSQGKATVKTTVTLENGEVGSFAVPSGESTGRSEAVLVPVEKALDTLNNYLKKLLLGQSYEPQSLDEYLIKIDGTTNKSNLGGNTILSVSIAFAKACALRQKRPLYSFIQTYLNNSYQVKPKIPKTMFNLIEGGKHAPNSLDLQEFLFLPTLPTTEENLKFATQVLAFVKEAFGGNSTFGEEGGITSSGFHNNSKALELLNNAALSLRKGNFSLAIDAAANSFKVGANYFLKDGNISYNQTQLSDFYLDLTNKFPLFSIEDPFSEVDWSSWEVFRKKVLNKVRLIGDDLTTTNVERIRKAVSLNAIDGVIIKPNQIGTLSETLKAVRLAQENNLIVIVSHRARETMDDFIADLAVGVGADFLKAGSPTQKERLIKYQRLVDIEKELFLKFNSTSQL